MRSPFLALVVGLTLSATSQAQTDPFGTIHYTQSPSLYRISGAPNSVPSLVPGAPDPAIRPTDLKYDGRHRYFTLTKDGTMPGRGHIKGDFYLWDEATGGSIKLTSFAGPTYYTPTGLSATRWSNDRQDTFLSFLIEDPAAGITRLLRTRVTAATPNWGQIIVTSGSGFVPFDETDLLPAGRLEVVGSWPYGIGNLFESSPSGDVFYYLNNYTVNGINRSRLRVHSAGDTPTSQDTVIFDEATTGVEIGPFTVSPVTGQIICNGLTVKVSRNGSKSYVEPSGVITVDPATKAWSWLLTNATATKRGGVTGLTGVATGGILSIAPDGSGFCFPADRYSNGTWVAKGLYKMGFSDGTVSTIREVSTSDPTFGVRRWTR
jgi:hypothetical protein